MLLVSQLFIYPIKSLGGIEITYSQITDRGLKYDRRWMLVDQSNRFLSQREFAVMALLKTSIEPQGLRVKHVTTNDNIFIPFDQHANETGEFSIWDDICSGIFVSADADAWFSNMLGTSCRLVYMPDTSVRLVDKKYAPEDKITSFSDAYPFLMIGQASLDDLNSRLEEQLSMDRFRPNIVFTGADAYAEDTMASFKIGNVLFQGSKLCARCNVPTIDQNTGIAAKEPTHTLAKYRRRRNKVYLGQNLVHTGEGVIHVGDKINLLEIKEMLNSLTLAD